MIGIVLFKTAVAVYLASAVVYGISLWGRKVQTARIATWLMLAALVIHTLSSPPAGLPPARARPWASTTPSPSSPG